MSKQLLLASEIETYLPRSKIFRPCRATPRYVSFCDGLHPSLGDAAPSGLDQVVHLRSKRNTNRHREINRDTKSNGTPSAEYPNTG